MSLAETIPMVIFTVLTMRVIPVVAAAGAAGMRISVTMAAMEVGEMAAVEMVVAASSRIRS